MDNFKRVLNDADLRLNEVLCRTICICAVYSDDDIKIGCKRLSDILSK